VAPLKRREALAAAAARAKTPFYFYDAIALQRAADRWRRAAGSRAKIFYPYTCNRHPPLLDHLAAAGFGAEINVAGDLSRAIGRRIGADRLVVHGPAKAEDFIDAAIAAGATLVADGIEDADAIFGRGRALDRRPPYLLRVRSPHARAGQRDLGMPPADAAAILERARRGGHPLPSGLAFHLGTGLPGPGPYLGSIRSVARTAALLREAGAPVRILDVGGGFSTAAESRFDDRGRLHRSTWTEPATIVRDLVSEVRRRIGDPEIWIEPGRALVAEAFHLVTRVVRVRGKREIFVDASRMSHGFFVSRGEHPIASIPARRGPSVMAAIAGPLGTDLDVFVRGIRMAVPRVGDVLVIGAVGAYNLIAANEWAGPVPPVVGSGDLA
jgi:diaminopimelate decarboxylase